MQNMDRKKIYSILLQISKETGVPVKKIQDMLYILSSGKPVDNTMLIQDLGVSRNALNQVKLLLSKYLKDPSKYTQLNAEGEKEIKNMFFGSGYLTEESLFNLLENQQHKENVEFLRSVENLRPNPNREYDQFIATVETVAKRGAILQFMGDIEGKRVLFLGDDDFTSIAIAKYKKAEEITVLDIDKRILDGIGNISKKQNFGIKTALYDARKLLPKDFLGKYDIVFIDPPYTANGTGLFVSRAIDALNAKNQSARLYLCYGNSDRAKERFIPIYNYLADSGLMLRWVFDKFNRYNGAEAIGSSSSLFICDVTPKTKPLIKGDYKNEDIYTNI
jgi:predicted methyltransferase